MSQSGTDWSQLSATKRALLQSLLQEKQSTYRKDPSHDPSPTGGETLDESRRGFLDGVAPGSASSEAFRPHRMNAPLVSCLCVTHGRVGLLQRAVACFLYQTYAPRELVMVYSVDDLPTRDFIYGQRHDPRIRPVEVGRTPPLSLGALRNRALDAASGFYIAQWDDDDWYGPDRLSVQIGALEESGKPACMLWRVIMFDVLTQKAYLSMGRGWEGTLVGRRDAVPPYPPLPRQEDTPVVLTMYRQGKLALFDIPQLYVYVYHGQNTWDRAHWELLTSQAQPLADAQSQEVWATLGRTPVPA